MPATALRVEAPAPADPRLIVPLDLPTRAAAEAMVAAIGDAVSFYKVGLELLATDGMAFARDLKAEGKRVFCDWKLHDIGAQVERATAAITASEACDLLTVHAEPQVMAAAVRGRGGASHLEIVGVTVLTSLSEADLAELGYGLTVAALVERRVGQARAAGLDGVVASPHEAALARRIGGPGSASSPPACAPRAPRRTIRPGRRPRPRRWPRGPTAWSAAARSPARRTRERPPCGSWPRWPTPHPADSLSASAWSRTPWAAIRSSTRSRRRRSIFSCRAVISISAFRLTS